MNRTITTLDMRYRDKTKQALADLAANVPPSTPVVVRFYCRFTKQNKRDVVVKIKGVPEPKQLEKVMIAKANEVRARSIDWKKVEITATVETSKAMYLRLIWSEKLPELLIEEC